MYPSFPFPVSQQRPCPVAVGDICGFPGGFTLELFLEEIKTSRNLDWVPPALTSLPWDMGCMSGYMSADSCAAATTCTHTAVSHMSTVASIHVHCSVAHTHNCIGARTCAVTLTHTLGSGSEAPDRPLSDPNWRMTQCDPETGGGGVLSCHGDLVSGGGRPALDSLWPA